MTSTYFARFYGDEPRTLYVVHEPAPGFPMGFRFDRASADWVLDISAMWEVQGDMNVWEVTAEAAAELEARIRAE